MMTSTETKDRVDTFHELRRRVLDWGTRPLNGDPKIHLANKARARRALAEACRPFDPALPPDAFWRHAWSAFRDSADDMAAHDKAGPFADYRGLSGEEWNFPRQATAKSGWGAAAQTYIDGEAPYNDPALIRDGGLLKRTIQIARALDEAVTAHGDRYLDGLFGAGFLDAAAKPSSTATVIGWLDHYLGLMSGDNDAVGLRLMEALGLPVAKPDPVLTDMLFRLGWLDGHGLPKDMKRADLPRNVGKRRVYKAGQAALHDIAEGIDPSQPENPVREISWVLARYGRPPRPADGLARTLDSELPVEASGDS